MGRHPGPQCVVDGCGLHGEYVLELDVSIGRAEVVVRTPLNIPAAEELLVCEAHANQLGAPCLFAARAGDAIKGFVAADVDKVAGWRLVGVLGKTGEPRHDRIVLYPPPKEAA